MSETKFYLTQHIIVVLISALEARRSCLEVSPDLNLSVETIPLEENRVVLAGASFTLEELRDLSKSLNGIILIRTGKMEKLEFFADGYYKLRPTTFAPTVEIDGIRMHRTKDIDPWEDSRRKVSHVVRKGDVVLDTCGGLGYTAIWAVKSGAEEVVSVEQNPSIIKLRNLNPHSEGLFNSLVSLTEGDISELITGFSASIFDSIIHDPPRFSLAGDLYGGDFYGQLYRVLKPGGRMFHYTGDPYRKGRGRRFMDGIIKRLHNAGFEPRHLPRDLGVYAKRV